MTNVLTDVRRTVINLFATADLWGVFVAPLVALVLLLGTRWAVLSVRDRLADGGYGEDLNVVDEHVGIDLEAATNALPERTGVPL